MPEDDLLRLAASAERGSEHPLGKALIEASNDRSLPLDEDSDFRALPGHGVEAQVNGSTVVLGNPALMKDIGVSLGQPGESRARAFGAGARPPVFVAVDGHAAGVVAVADTLRPESREAVEAMHKLGLEVIMLTGDDRRTAEAIAAQVGIDRVIAEVLPDQKADKIRSLQEEGQDRGYGGRRHQRRPGLSQERTSGLPWAQVPT